MGCGWEEEERFKEGENSFTDGSFFLIETAELPAVLLEPESRLGFFEREKRREYHFVGLAEEVEGLGMFECVCDSEGWIIYMYIKNKKKKKYEKISGKVLVLKALKYNEKITNRLKMIKNKDNKYKDSIY